MIYILLSVLCSLVATVFLRVAPDRNVDVRLAIAGNYLVASLLCVVFLHASPAPLWTTAADARAWLVLVALGILLPTLFLAMAISIARVGVVRTDAAHRLSLVLALIAAFTVFGEALTATKLIGVLLGVMAVACIVVRPGPAQAVARRDWLWPVVVFAGTGLIDILFKEMAVLTAVPFEDVLLASFLLALALSCIYVGWLFATGRARWAWRHAAGAVLLGSFNFANILFFIEAHRQLADNPALVFAAMNISVIVLATGIGVWAFREQLRRVNRAGIVMAVLAVAVLARA
ncbi:MAG TPA: DMT family transporter [Nevskiaceae bacterium]